MAFNPQPEIHRIPTRIRDMEWSLFKSVDPDDIKFPEGIEFSFTVDDQNNKVMGRVRGDLTHHLTSQEKSQLRNLFNKYWTKAEQEVLP